MNQHPQKEYPTKDPAFRSGFAALLGEPNVGKSTLLNAILDFKIAIVTPKPQTTRDAIRGVYTDKRKQIVFVDTPGVMEPQDTFNTYLRDRALEEIENADIALHLVEAPNPRPLPEAAQKTLTRLATPAILVATKADLLNKKFQPEKTRLDLTLYQSIHLLSGVTREGIDSLLEAVAKHLPEGDCLYDPDQITDRDMRYLAAEIVREKILQLAHQEVPYAVATQTEEFKERQQGKYFLRVIIYVEHESQKGILIGNRGEMLRAIGAAARPDIEAITDHSVYLELWVKVRNKWRKKEHALREFGYKPHRSKNTKGTH